MEEGLEFHIEVMRMHGEIVPEPSSLAEMLEVAGVLTFGITMTYFG